MLVRALTNRTDDTTSDLVYSITGKRVMLGVSLANRVFSRAFVRRVFRWLNAFHIQSLDVVLFDALERVNYRIFRGLDEEEATTIARTRGAELARMLERTREPAAFPHRVIQESASAERTSPRFASLCAELWQAWRLNGRFRADVETQVLLNLGERIERHGREVVIANIESLAEYVIEESAFLVAYFEQRPHTVEIYPGVSMVVKENLFRGHYCDECPTASLKSPPAFVDITWLLDAPRAAQSITAA